MPRISRKVTVYYFFISALTAFTTACSAAQLPSIVSPSPKATLTQTIAAVSPTPVTPTPTPEPLAAKVNGAGIPLAVYQASLVQLQKADADLKKTAAAADQSKRVLDDLVDQELLAQAAGKDGYHPSQADLDGQLSQIAAKAGGQSALQAWEQANGYTDASLRDALALSLAAAWERDRIAAAVPAAVEQVHARQILVKDQATAQSILSRVQAGANFASLAFKYDPTAGGDLGWFPKGYLNVPEVETAAFGLQPGQTSAIIQSQFGYHIVQVIERDPKHLLSPDARLVYQQAALKNWLADQRSQSQVTVLIPQ